ncbi:hypothetical protein OIU77_005951 [Salix suchowensis]|uniref:Uncharacterized protein n=1 Tax=Salix suchowensis TaxID=1278906 RepID=A0ABQ9AR67_9ROSI|nr:hypothetical protein OIU77_005951 [Salix suchowensis]
MLQGQLVNNLMYGELIVATQNFEDLKGKKCFKHNILNGFKNTTLTVTIFSAWKRIFILFTLT